MTTNKGHFRSYGHMFGKESNFLVRHLKTVPLRDLEQFHVDTYIMTECHLQVENKILGDVPRTPK